MKKILFTTMAVIYTAFSFGQTFTVSGKITEGTSPIVGANVLVKETTTGVISDFNGHYSIALEQGSYILVFSYASQAIEKSILLDKNTTLNINLSESPLALDEVLVSAVRVAADSPITHSNLNAEDLEKRNLGQDLATQLNFLPGVVTTSDAGAGIGYTGFRVRGTGNQGINVTINGIPYNDSESLTTFFVNLQDFTSSVENLQLQRGVGSSTNGSGAFGASLNILTDAISQDAYGETSHSFGSFNTRRHNVKFSTGLLNDHIEVSGRISQIKSDGYIDRASSDLKSYFLQAAYKDDNTLIKAINFAGSEVTYQSWYGFEETSLNFIGANTNIDANRTFNIAGVQLDNSGNITGFHNNQVDDYKQDHYQLHWNQKYDANWSSTASFNYTYGRGFFEEYIDDYYEQNYNFGNESTLAFYGISPQSIGGETIETSDIIRRRWLDNDFFVANASVNYRDNQFDITGGLLGSIYRGDHFGEVIWARFAGDSELGDRYYFGTGDKDEVSAFAKANFRLDDTWQFYVDLQGRFISYETQGLNSDVEEFLVDESYAFFNPKFGVSYKVSPKSQFYASYARANREPNRGDFEDGSPRAEKLNDFELGWRFKSAQVVVNVNGYFMDYDGQLVPTGALDNSGAPIRVNSNSYRAGIEVDAAIEISQKLMLQPNLALSSNKNRDFLFDLDGAITNLGNTNISYSPKVVASNMLTYTPINNLSLGLLSKYVGEQYMGNIDSELSKLDAYFLNDLSIQYELNNIPVFNSIVFNALVNNIFDKEYISNGYFFTYNDDFSVPGEVTTIEGVGYYPQAGINFLMGATLKF
ncbi:TonB-dependent receptor [Dokdonia sp. Hel_I_53]|uniref:TonB-dependent receptor n=1 Tax=Dokdonia sp. Hel_I_53 TaxID=1566287 RepID=UPI00119BA97A|nr:TonB-dependent receptor [Dokdonia sp. Hel_I_53]TVZ52821.1 iron complex outermembrane receptor protein [Dokdonia sp. Hel_I_53]